MSNVIICLTLFLLPVLGHASNYPKPPSAETLIQKKFPGSKSLVQTECEIGEAKIKSVGHLIQKESLKNSEHPLIPVIVYYTNQQWILSEVPKRLEYSKGSTTDFLSDFWNTKTGGLKGTYEIRCASPNEDKGISVTANGEFSKDFRNKKNGKHVCFQADAVYNSWACFSFNPGTKDIESSFSQMNAD